jgi:copper resistance protein D
MTALSFCCEGATLDVPLIWVRATHFAATILASGTVFFLAFIAEPALRKAGGSGPLRGSVRSQSMWLTAIGLIVAVTSGAAWFLLVAARMADLPVPDILSDATVWSDAISTDFGRDWIVRLALVGLLVGSFFAWPRDGQARSAANRLTVLASAAGLVGTLAWAGHGATGSGAGGALHLIADILHLIAAAAWVGALPPLALLLATTRLHGSDALSIVVAREAVQRFSTFGFVSVGTLLVTGIINSWLLVGSLATLTGTDYGRLLLVKIALFLLMLAVAGINRMLLTPRLMRADEASAARLAQRQLQNSSLIEAAVAVIILTIVAVLGTLPPSLQG